MALYKCELAVTPWDIQRVPREVLEMDAILNLIKGIPLEELKKVVGFEEWNPVKTVPKTPAEGEYLESLAHSQRVVFKCQMLIPE